jgi:hypothetical protein
MLRSTTAPPAGRHEHHRQRSSAFRIWLLCAAPWLALVAGLSIYDHQRAIGLMAQGVRSDGAIAFAFQWMVAALTYSGSAIAFYGLLPLGITFVVFVLFLSWAIPWAQGGEYED